MNKMMAITINPGATTAALLDTEPGTMWFIMGPPAATRTKKKVPSNSEKSRRHSRLGFAKSANDRSTVSSYSPNVPSAV